MHRDVDQEEAKSTDVVVDVEECALNVLSVDSLILISAVLRLKPFHGDTAFAFVQEMTLHRAFRHEIRGS